MTEITDIVEIADIYDTISYNDIFMTHNLEPFMKHNLDPFMNNKLYDTILVKMQQLSINNYQTILQHI